MNGNIPQAPQAGQPGGVQSMPSNGGANQIPGGQRPMPGIPGQPGTMPMPPGFGGGMGVPNGGPAGGMGGMPAPGGGMPGGGGAVPGGRYHPTWNPQLAAMYDRFNATGQGPGVPMDARAGPGAGPAPGLVPQQPPGGNIGGPGMGDMMGGLPPQLQTLIAQNPQLMQALQRMKMQGGNPGMPGIMPSNPGANSGAAPGGGLLGLLGGVKPPGGQIQNPLQTY